MPSNRETNPIKNGHFSFWAKSVSKFFIFLTNFFKPLPIYYKPIPMKPKKEIKLISLANAIKHYQKHGSIKLTGKSVKPFKEYLNKKK
jgi:hypothetical protein